MWLWQVGMALARGAKMPPLVPARGEQCPYSVRVYVYEFPARLKFVEAARKARADRAGHFDGEHLLAQFSLEFVLTDFFEQSCIRTLDADKADFYFVPFFSDIEYREAGRPDQASEFGAALLDILERNDTRAWGERFGVTDAYWRKYPQRHILVQAAPVTGWRHPKGRRGWHHYKVQLNAPIFVSIEVTRSWVKQYPKCSAKNSVLPYPVPGRAWHDESSRESWRMLAQKLLKGGDRPVFAMYRGGRHGCVNVRTALAKDIEGDDDVKASTRALDRRFGRAVPRQLLMHASVFCPCPEGDSPSAKRQYDALLAGCVPVLVSDDALYAYDESFLENGVLNTSDFALRIPEQTVVDHGILESLRSVPPEAIARLQKGGELAARYYRYYATGRYADDPLPSRAYPDGGALALLVSDLEMRVRRGEADSRWFECLAERAEPHLDIAKQFCGTPPRDKELWRLRGRLRATRDADARASLSRAIHDWETPGFVFR